MDGLCFPSGEYEPPVPSWSTSAKPQETWIKALGCSIAEKNGLLMNKLVMDF